MNNHGFTKGEFKEITKASLFFSNRCRIRTIDRDSVEFSILKGLISEEGHSPTAILSIDERNSNVVAKIDNFFVVYFFDDYNGYRTTSCSYLDEAIFHAVRSYEDELYLKTNLEGGINDSVFSSFEDGARMSVALNPYQGVAQRVLCVCSAGILRSPTIAEVLRDLYGFNCRSAGVVDEYALIRVDDVLASWAEHIVCATLDIALQVEKKFPKHKGKIIAFKIPDNFSFRNSSLVEKIKKEAFIYFG